MKKTYGDYINSVSNYLNAEYIDSITEDTDLTADEKWMIRNIIYEHYENGDSFANAANLIVEYLRDNRKKFQS